MRPVWLMVAALAVANVAWAESAPKIGFVDMQRALLETDAGKKAQQTAGIEGPGRQGPKQVEDTEG